MGILLTVVCACADLHCGTGEITTKWIQGLIGQFVKCNLYIKEMEYGGRLIV